MASQTTTSPFSRLLLAQVEGTAASTRHQQSQLQRLHKALADAKVDLISAIKDDHDHSDFEAAFEYCSALSSTRKHYESKDIAMEVEKSRSLELGKDNLHRAVGVGIVYIIPTSHTPLHSIVSPLSAAIAAGNCVIVEITPTTRKLSSVLRALLTKTLHADTFAVSKSRPNADFLRRCKVVVETDVADLPDGQQQHLASPSNLLNIAFVDRTADLVQTSRALASSRFAFGGTSPYAPDLIMVHEAVKDLIVEQLTNLLPQYAKDKPEKSFKQQQFEKNVSEEDHTPAQDITSVASYSRNRIVEVVNGDSSLLNKKRHESTLLLYSVTSMDHAIDRANRLGVLGASYIFAALEESNYLANSINAHLTCVNQVPTELLVGPLAPLNFAASISPRFTPAMFQESRPQLLTRSSITDIISTSPNSSNNHKLQKWMDEAQLPLGQIGYPDGKKTGFFEQALLMGVIVSGLTLSTAIGLVTTVIWKRLR